MDQRRFRGLCERIQAIIAILLTVWAGQDFTYDPSWIHPMGYYMIAAFLLSFVLIGAGMRLRGEPPNSIKRSGLLADED